MHKEIQYIGEVCNMDTIYKGLVNKWMVLALFLAALGAVLTVTLLPAGAQVATIKFPENSEAAVADFTAVDPEGRSLATWSIAEDADLPVGDVAVVDNADAALFDISSAGVLTFNDEPDFEMPRGEDLSLANTNTYQVVIAATDSQQTTYEKVEVEVTNEEEAATTDIELNLVQPREAQPVTVVYTDGEGNPYLDENGLSITPAAGATLSGIMDPDMGKDDVDETAIPAEDVAWQWSRGASKNGSFTDITEAENGTRNQISYNVIDADRGMYLRVTATYQDGHGKGKTLTADSLFPASPHRADTIAPSFPSDFDRVMDGEQGPSAEVADGAGEGTNVGSPVGGRAESGERLTYSIAAEASSTTDSHTDLFQIDRATGQVSVGLDKTVNPFSDLNTLVPGPKPAAADNEITITIMIIDGAPAHIGDDPDDPGTDINIPHTATVPMTITVKPEVDEPPVFTEDKTSHEYAENKAQEEIESVLYNHVDTFNAYDPEAVTVDGTVSYELTGTDKDAFTTVPDSPDPGNLILAFTNQPDYEKPGDANKDNIYEVTLTASATSLGETEKSTPLHITVEVINVNEDGVVSMSAREPRIGVPISAMVDSDDDGRVTGVSWQWERDTTGGPEPDGTPTVNCNPVNPADLAWEDAEGEGTTSSTYTPNRADDGKCLRATASYTDPQGPGSTNVVSSEAVEKARNLAPKFRDDDGITPGIQINPRFVVENAAENAVVVINTNGSDADSDSDAALDRVLATDDLDAEGGDDNMIAYSLSGSGASAFSISDDSNDQSTGGQISVKSGANLDYETQRVYMVTVTAADLEGLRSSVMVMINIVDQNEGPEIMEGRLAVSGAPLVLYTSMSEDNVATYTAVGVDAPGATWDLSGDDAGDFRISSTGVLTFNSPPDSGNSMDADMDNMYEVTVEASSGDSDADKDVTVIVGSATAAVDPTSLSDFSSQQRIDLNSDGIVSDDEVMEALRIWLLDNLDN